MVTKLIHENKELDLKIFQSTIDSDNLIIDFGSINLSINKGDGSRGSEVMVDKCTGVVFDDSKNNTIDTITGFRLEELRKKEEHLHHLREAFSILKNDSAE